MHKLKRVLLAGMAGLALGACSDVLNVTNENNPDQNRALNRPTDVEALIAGSFNTLHRATVGSNNMYAPMGALGMENYSNLANFSMGVRSQIPRPPISNSRNNNAATENYSPFLNMHRAARAAALGLNRVNRSDFTFFPASASQTARAKAFAHFVIGVSLGLEAMSYDSGSTVNENDDLTSNTPLPLVDYNAVAAYSLAKLDSAIAAAGAMGTQVIPNTWLAAGGNTYTAAQFIALARGYKARIRAGVARNPTERAAVAWNLVIADAAAFVAAFPTDAVQLLTPSLGWDHAWVSQMYASNSVNWHQIWGIYAGMAGDQAGFDAWLSTPVLNRVPYTVVSADLRWPQGATRAAQQADASTARYFQNRASGDDWFGEPLGNSQYRHTRYLALRNASRIGNYVLITTAEMNLLAAEGQYRQGNFAAAAALADLTRISRGGLPGLVANGVTNATTLVPGGANCVPRIPVAPFTSSACGNLFEAIKWEYRMETYNTTMGAWYFAGRGWGDLPLGTSFHWATPYQEQDTRRNAAFGDPAGQAAAGTYGI